MTVTIDRATLAEVIAHMRAAAPHEGVGLLAGRATFPGGRCPADTDGDGGCGRRNCPTCGPPEMRRVVARRIGAQWAPVTEAHLGRWMPLDNVAEFPRVQYAVDPVELLAAHEALEADGFYPWVVVHSHVAVDAVPSEPDVEYARNPSQLHMIVSLAGLHAYFTRWQLDPDAVPGHGRRVKIPWRVVDQPKQGISPTDLTRGVTEG